MPTPKVRGVLSRWTIVLRLFVMGHQKRKTSPDFSEEVREFQQVLEYRISIRSLAPTDHSDQVSQRQQAHTNDSFEAVL